MPLELQPKRCVCLQDGELNRVGGTRTIEIGRSSRSRHEPATRAVVEDASSVTILYYRLNVFRYARRRCASGEDNESLVRHFVRLFAGRIGRRIEFVPAEALEALRRHPCPGTFAKLQNLIEGR